MCAGFLLNDIGVNIMAKLKSKSAMLMNLALMAAATLAPRKAFANRMPCSDISFNDLHCPAYLPPTQKNPERNADASSFRPECSDLSFGDSWCTSYAPPARKNREHNLIAVVFHPECSDISFGDSRCPAYNRRPAPQSPH